MFLVLLALLTAVALARIGYVYWTLKDPLNAKMTTTRMIELMGVLESDQPIDVDRSSIQRLLEHEHRLSWLEDGWEHPLLVTRQIAGGRAVYTIVSLGRSGRRSRCCTKWVASWDENAVLEGKDWLQVWYPRAAKP